MKAYKRSVQIGALLLVSILLFSFFPKKAKTTEKGSAQSTTLRLPSPSAKDEMRMLTGNQMQLGFIENKGQLRNGEDIAYYFQHQNIGMYLKKTSISYVFKQEISPTDTLPTKELTQRPRFIQKRLDMNWEGCNPKVQLQASKARTDLRHFYTGSDSESLTHIRNFGEILYEELYPNIDMRLYFQGSQLKYDFVVKPGGKVADIQMYYSGQDTMFLQPDGSINLQHVLGTLEEGAPYSYQVIEGDTTIISSSYCLENERIQFNLEEYHTEETLIIDPTLEWATYYGAEEVEKGNAVCTDEDGNVYIAGETGGYLSFPTNNVHQTLHGGGSNDAFLAKYDPSGNLLWTTYYGGQDDDAALSVCLNSWGYLFMAGWTHSNVGIAFGEGFFAPHDDTYNESNSPEGNRFNRDAFLARFLPTDGTIVWGTYYGGEDGKSDEARSICPGLDGTIYLAGFSKSSQNIALDGFQETRSGKADAFLARFDGGSGDLIWATYYGGENSDVANAVATDDWGNVYIAGFTESDGLAFKGHDPSYSANQDAFLVKFNPEGELYWATYYGDIGIDQAHSIAIHKGYVYLAGITSSPSAIAKLGHDMNFNGGMDAFLVQFGTFGHRLWGTYYGGSEDEGLRGFTGSSNPDYLRTTHVSVSRDGEIYLSGLTESPTNIATANGYDQVLNNGVGTYKRDGFLIRFLSNGNRQWGTYYGGEKYDHIQASCVDKWGSVYVTGPTHSPSGISHNGYENDYDGADAFLAKFYPYGSGPNDHPNEEEDPHDPEEPYPSRPGKNSVKKSDAGNLVQAQLYLYPNPSKDLVHVYLSGTHDQAQQLLIQDLQGKTVYTQTGLKGTIDQEVEFESALSWNVCTFYTVSRSLYLGKTPHQVIAACYSCDRWLPKGWLPGESFFSWNISPSI